MKLGYIGLGKMGSNMVSRLRGNSYEVVAYDTSGSGDARSLADLVGQLSVPRILWLMVPHEAVGGVLEELTPLLEKGDVVIDGGNSFYKDSAQRAKELAEEGIYFLDVGVSGGPRGAKNGAVLMIGGPEESFRTYEMLFRDLSAPEGYGYMGEAGPRHFL